MRIGKWPRRRTYSASWNGCGPGSRSWHRHSDPERDFGTIGILSPQRPVSLSARMDVKWDDTDPDTGKRRFVKAERFAGRWAFYCRRERRGVWEKWAEPPCEMWGRLLEAVGCRVRRPERVGEQDVEQVRKVNAVTR